MIRVRDDRVLDSIFTGDREGGTYGNEIYRSLNDEQTAV